MLKRTSIRSLAGAALLALSIPWATAQTVIVTNGDDSGPGSFRDAVQQANNDGSITTIVVQDDVDTIQVSSTVTYTGTQDLTINGNGAAVQPGAAGAFDLFVTSGGGDLALQRLVVQNSAANGVTVLVPFTATGDVSVSLSEVTLSGNDGFGLHVNDLASSSAGVVLHIEFSVIDLNGYAASDLDGVRVDERGLGNIAASISSSTLSNNGADGIELDERDDGGVTLDVAASDIVANGPFDPQDLDDGIDIDESDIGDIEVAIANSNIIDNRDEGLDLNEFDQGSVFLQVTNIVTTGTGDEGIAVEEHDDGSIRADISNITASNNGAEGIELEELDSGDIEFRIANSFINGNADDGTQVTEAGDGNLLGEITNSDLTGNAPNRFSIRVEQRDDGTGLLVLNGVTYDNKRVRGLTVVE